MFSALDLILLDENATHITERNIKEATDNCIVATCSCELHFELQLSTDVFSGQAPTQGETHRLDSVKTKQRHELLKLLNIIREEFM